MSSPDVRSFTVGPVQENCYLVRAGNAGTRAVIVDPGEESERLLAGARELGVEIEAILITHCHFDHIGAVAPVARATGAPVYCPEIERVVLADVMRWVPPGFGPFESYEAEHLLAGGERLALAGLEVDVIFTPGHSPGHLTYAISPAAPGAGGERSAEAPAGTALLSGDVLFQGSVGRVDLPGGDWATLERSIGGLLRAFPGDTFVYPGHMGVTTLGRERDTNPFLAELRSAAPGTGARRDGSRKLSAPRIKAPRGTFDVLGEQAEARAELEGRARAILEGAGYERIETPAFEATELFARAVGESTDIVRKEMFTLNDSSGRSLTLRPEGTAPVCRAYVEHGMHKRRQPVKLWYMSSFFRHERAQAGRYRQFWQVGAEALGSADPAVDAESIVLLARLLEEAGVSTVRLRLSSLGGPAARAEYRARLQAYLREHQAGLSGEVRARIELNPLRAFDSDHEGTKRVMSRRPRLSEHLSEADAEHLAEVCELLAVANVPYELDDTLVRGLDYYTRTVFEFTSEALGAQSGVGGGGRYDGLVEALGGPPAPGMGWAAGVERILLAGAPEQARAVGARGSGPAAASPLELFVALEEPGAEAPPGEDRGPGPRDDGQPGSAGPAGARATRRAAFALLGEARAAGITAQMELAGRSLKGQLGHANSLGARYVAIVADGQAMLRDMQEGGQQQIATDTVVQAVLQGLHTL